MNNDKSKTDNATVKLRHRYIEFIQKIRR